MLKHIEKNQRILLILYFILLYFIIRYMFLPINATPLVIVVNYLLTLPIFGLLLSISNKIHIAVLLHSSILFLFYFVDHVLYQIRLTHMRYSDLFAINDGLRVLSKYTIPFTAKDLFLLCGFVLLNIIFTLSAKKMKTNQSKRENTILGLMIVLLTSFTLVGGIGFRWIPDTTDYSQGVFDTNSTSETNGLFYALYNQFRNSFIIKPENYSPNAAKAILQNYEQAAEAKESDQARIIVIMNESLSDYSLIGQTSFSDPLTNIHRPEHGYFEGKLAVSVFAGYTCNTEYEFLTGNALRFFPPAYIPFSQLIVSDTPSLVWDLKHFGIQTIGLHPYYSQEWNRKQVYPHLGFDQFIAGEDLGSGLMNVKDINNITDVNIGTLDFGNGLEYVRGFVSDDECYKQIETLLDNSARFVFAVTIQNHGGYNYEGHDFSNNIYLKNNNEINQYLTLESLSDAAFQRFIDRISKDDEKTLVFMFGDHQPGLDFSDCVEGYSESTENMYYVPYIVWSNYDIDCALPSVVSVNYLSAILKQCAGVPLNEWDRLRLTVMESYPVLTPQIILDKNLSETSTIDDMLLREYEHAQYYRINTKDKGGK